MNDNLNSRWYDKDPKLTRVVELMEALPLDVQEELAVNLIHFVNIIRRNRNEIENPISIGKSRVLGLYKAFNKRRWYDKRSILMSAMNTLSTLPFDDCTIIAEGLIRTLESKKH